ncbi:MAG TPA: efflux transporter outer membrane subunit [Thermomonas sp.]|nr:efflux transporter outer membrane subunit [Thermomonas sp.]
MSIQSKAATCILVASLTACTVGPDFVKPDAAVPEDWTTWRSGDESLHVPVTVNESLPPDWWRAFNDPVLDRLQQRAIEGSPDLLTATLHFAQARQQRIGVASQQLPGVRAGGDANRQAQSENNSGMRLIDAIGLPNRDQLAKVIAQPFNYYQVGFDASWEIDLWGRVRRSIESADADVARQEALLDLARLGLASDVARNYFELRNTQRQIVLIREDIATLEERLGLLQARAKGGLIDYVDVERQLADTAALKSQLPGLLAQEAVNENRIALLLGEHPGALRRDLAPAGAESEAALPDLALGLPSEVARRRPDIRAAEARLQGATAEIGVATANLYPSVTLGAHAGYDSYLAGQFLDSASQAWFGGLSVNLPLFDHGRRKSEVELSRLRQQEAAVDYQRTVLKAWQEIDDALNGYSAERQQLALLRTRVESTGEAYKLVQAKYEAGTVDFVAVIDSQRGHVQARRDLAASLGRLSIWFVTVNKAIGNTQPR